jgi:hypothetical protein
MRRYEGRGIGRRLSRPLHRLQKQLHLKQMPPKKKAPLSAEEREQVLGWVSGELAPHRASKLEEKLGQPD